MSAFDEFMLKNSSINPSTYRKALVSQRGNLVNGSIIDSMNISKGGGRRSIIELDDVEEIDASTSASQFANIYAQRQQKVARESGFVFDSNGTQRIIQKVISDVPISITRDVSNNFLFSDAEKKEKWNEAQEAVKRRLIARNLQQMKRKTDVQYRICGSRCQYFILGKTTADVREGYTVNKYIFPLFMFGIPGIDTQKQLVQIEQVGFMNFAMDEKFLDSEIQKHLGTLNVEMNDTLPAELSVLKRKVENIQLPNIESIELDPTFGAITIITGLETEYLDPVWEKNLRIEKCKQ